MSDNSFMRWIIDKLFILLFILIILYNVTPIKINSSFTEVKKADYGELEAFLVMADKFKDSHKYDINKYNCVNYTREMSNIAKTLGYKVKTIKGCTEPKEGENQSCHAFMRLEVDFEPQDGIFVDYSKKYPLQEDKEYK